MYALTSRKDELPSSRESREANYASDARTMQSTSWRGGGGFTLTPTDNCRGRFDTFAVQRKSLWILHAVAVYWLATGLGIQFPVVKCGSISCMVRNSERDI